MKLFSPAEILLAYLFVGLVAGGGFRDPVLWTSASAVIWLVAIAWPEPKALPLLKRWAPWLGWTLLSLLACDQPFKGFYAFGRWTTLIVFFGLASAHWTERDSKRWLAGLALSAMTLGLASVWLHGIIHPMTGLLPPYYNYTMFVEAAFLAACLGLLLHQDGPKGWRRLAFSGPMIFALFILVKARSRGALAGVAAAAAFAAVRRGRTKPFFLGLSAIAIAALLAPQASSYLLKMDMTKWFTRPQIWRAALEIVRDHPLLGEGPGNFEEGFVRHNFPKHWATNYGFYSDHAHSEIFELAAETGIIGLGLFLTALFGTIRPVKPKETSAIQEGALCALAAMVAQCAVDNMLQLPALGMLFFSAIACARGIPAQDAAPTPKIWRPAAAMGLLLCLIAYGPRRMVERYTDMSERQADPRARLVFIERALKIYPADYFLHEKAARANLYGGRTDDARAELEIASRLNPTNAVYPKMLADIALARGERGQALEQASRAIELEPNFLSARLLRAGIWKKSGETKAARLELDGIRKRREELKRLSVYGDYDQAIVAFDQAAFDAAVKARSP